MTTYPLLEYVQAVADANGRAAATIGPKKYGDSWTVNLLATVTDSTSESQLRVYRGAEVDTAIVASSYSGNQDTAGGNAINVPSQDKLVFVWTGASVGANCTCRIEGDLNSRRR